MELKCQLMNYEWGKLGSSSAVANLYANANSDFKIEQETPYAELWMGTHPSGPSYVKGRDEKLEDLIEKNPEYLGEESCQQFGTKLPFLFKVLSINKALSIQAHPAKKHAEELHKTRPDLYKDSNHKPELAIALTPFQALCGFRPFEEIQNFFQIVPELSQIVGESLKEKVVKGEGNPSDLTKSVFGALMTSSDELIKEQLEKLLCRLRQLNNEDRVCQLADLVETLYGQFPGDVGCFSIYFLNVLTLKKFEALYLGANDPHAYFSGDCVECMACSDNVVRAGLTPKFKDVTTLVEMLNYEGQEAGQKILKPHVENEFSEIFKPPVPDFSVVKITIPPKKRYDLISRSSASILLCTEGNAQMDDSCKIVPGSVIFIPANVQHYVETENSEVLLFQAMANL